jgi:hypothetical protein
MIPLVPKNCETSLNVFGLMTDKKLMIKCCNKKIKRKRPDKAIKNFLPIDVFIE